MSTPATLADVRASRIPNVLNLVSTDTRLAAYVNEAQQRLLARGMWVGCVRRYRFCAANGEIALPREVEQVLGVTVCDIPIPIRTMWYEFMENAMGRLHEVDGLAGRLVDRGLSCSYKSVSANGNRIKVYCDLPGDATKQVFLQGNNLDSNRIQTLSGGSYVDGEYVTASVAGTLSVSQFDFDGLVQVQKPVTIGPIRLFEYNPTTMVQTEIAVYQPSETKPQFRRVLIPGLSHLGQCGTQTTDDFPCTDKVVEMLVKVAFVPVVNDTDWLVISSIPALRLMCQALKKEESNLFDDAKKYEAMAIDVLNQELQAFVGDSAVLAVRGAPRDVYGAGVANVL